MTPLFEAISSSLAPGIALNAVIFYNTSLQNRFATITGRMRDLNREARAIGEPTDARAVARLASLRRQVVMMAQRTRLLRRAILTLYLSLVSIVLTIVELLFLVVVRPTGVEEVALGTFAVGLVAMAASAGIAWRENFHSQQTSLEDLRSSFPGLDLEHDAS